MSRFDFISYAIGLFALIAFSSIFWTSRNRFESFREERTFDPFWFPASANAQANQRMVKELAEQNKTLREALSKLEVKP